MRTEEVKRPILSLCMPTNGIIEWVFPALESIYSQNVDSSLFEVVVTNNGHNDEFDKKMLLYAEKHKNLIYRKNDSFMFHNQLEALKLASGCYLKFINHRDVLKNGSLEKMINIIKKYEESKPVIFFSNGSFDNKEYVYENFDLFIRKLKRFVSWTAGVGIWKDDYDDLPDNIQIDRISPHSCILFSKREKKEYVVSDFKFADEIVTSHENKGTYDLFKAFAIEEPTIALKLYCDGDISIKTLKIVLKDYEKFVSELYCDFVIRKKKCSYDLTGFNDSMGVFFNKTKIRYKARLLLIKKIIMKIIFRR